MLSLETTPTIDQIKNAAKRYAIIGVGNLLQRDDGVGPESAGIVHHPVQRLFTRFGQELGVLRYLAAHNIRVYPGFQTLQL